jgi:hypothetical protein
MQPAGAKPHFSKCCGSTQQLKTRHRGASKVREIVKSFMFLVLYFELHQVVGQPIEAIFPERAKDFDIRGGPFKWLALHAAGSGLRDHPLLEEPCRLQHLEVLGDSREADRKRLRQLGNRRFALGKAGQDRPAGWIGEGAEY